MESEKLNRERFQQLSVEESERVRGGNGGLIDQLVRWGINGAVYFFRMGVEEGRATRAWMKQNHSPLKQ